MGPPAQRVPECGVFESGARPGLDKEFVILPAVLIEAAAYQVEDISVRSHDGSIGPETNDRLRAVNGGDLAGIIAAGQPFLRIHP